MNITIVDRSAYESLERAVRHLTSLDDDYATADNGMGWNKPDSYPGHGLATIPFADWTDQEIVWAYDRAFKYQVQLSEIGIDPYAFPQIKREGRISGAGLGRRQPAKPNPKQIALDEPYRYEYGTHTFAVSWKWGCDDFDAIKAVVKGFGFKYQGYNKVWVAPVTKTHAAEMVLLSRKFDFTIQVEAQAKIEELLADADVNQVIEQAAQGREDAKRGKLSVENGSIVLRSEYDSKVVDLVRGKMRWNKVDKTWFAPLASVTPILADALETLIVNHNFLADAEVIAAIAPHKGAVAAKIEASAAAEADFEIECPEGLAPFAYQVAGVRYVVDNGGVALIGDEMGLGKTIQALLSFKALKATKLLVICPASVKLNWVREIHKWIGLDAVALNGKPAVDLASYDAVVVNYDILGKWIDQIHTAGFDMVVVDESHYMKNYTSLRSQRVSEILTGRRKIARGQYQTVSDGIAYKLMLTGTAVENRPTEAISQLQALDMLNAVGGFWTIFNGSISNVELNRRLRASCYIRRRKADVLKDLPAKLRGQMVVEIDNRGEYGAAEDDIIEYLTGLGDLKGASRAQRAEYLVKIAKCRVLAARGKLGAIKEWVADFFDQNPDKSLVVWAHHREVQEMLLQTFAAMNPAHVLGSDSSQARQDQIDRFQARQTRLMVASLGAAREGITLTVAHHELMLEFAWNASRLDQAEDRCHRIGQTETVTILYMVAADTVDETILGIVERKRRMAKAVLDGVEDEDDTTALEEIAESFMRKVRR